MFWFHHWLRRTVTLKDLLFEYLIEVKIKTPLLVWKDASRDKNTILGYVAV